MRELLDGFVFYLIGKQGRSKNTILSYKRDIADYIGFLEERGIKDIKKTDRTTVLTYLLFLKKQGRASSTVSRRLAALRSFYSYAVDSGVDMKNPMLNLETPHVSRKTPEALTFDEVELLLSQPKCSDAKGYRDKAMLELLYATGIKVSELINLTVDDVNLKQGYINCRTASHERDVPVGHMAIAAVSNYIEYARPNLVPDKNVKFLFLNCNGTRLSRQGFWKILKQYRKSAGIEKDITPYTLRHSFAIHLLENGADIKAISQMLGHTDVSVTHMYSQLVDGGIRSIYDKAHPRA